jgi:hypothetical protein
MIKGLYNISDPMKRKWQNEKLHRSGHIISFSPGTVCIQVMVDELSGFVPAYGGSVGNVQEGHFVRDIGAIERKLFYANFDVR